MFSSTKELYFHLNTDAYLILLSEFASLQRRLETRSRIRRITIRIPEHCAPALILHVPFLREALSRQRREQTHLYSPVVQTNDAADRPSDAHLTTQPTDTLIPQPVRAAE